MGVFRTILYLCVITAIVAVVVLLVYKQVSEHYQQLDPMLQTIKDSLRPLHPRVESIDFFEGKKSYTINKKRIYLCLKDKNEEYYDQNMLLYVAIHELAHVLCDEIGHTAKFNRIFQEQLQRAVELGIYDPDKPIVRDYCGHT
ncbi:hypothetical protein EBZ80_02295 [bacterium]|nr:hypothetical protein [bacterium]